MIKKISNWFNQQPVGVRAALIIATSTIIVGLLSLIVGLLSFWADWHAPTVKLGKNDNIKSTLEKAKVADTKSPRITVEPVTNDVLEKDHRHEIVMTEVDDIEDIITVKGERAVGLGHWPIEVTVNNKGVLFQTKRMKQPKLIPWKAIDEWESARDGVDFYYYDNKEAQLRKDTSKRISFGFKVQYGDEQIKVIEFFRKHIPTREGGTQSHANANLPAEVVLKDGSVISCDNIHWILGGEFRARSTTGLNSPDIFIPLRNIKQIKIGELLKNLNGGLCKDHIEVSVGLKNGRIVNAYILSCDRVKVFETDMPKPQEIYIKHIKSIVFKNTRERG